MELSDIQTAINNGKLYFIEEIAGQLALYKKGCGSVKELNPVKRLIHGLQFQYDFAVIDDDTYKLYGCLISALGGYGEPYTPDPNVVIPGGSVVVIPVGGMAVSEPIPFSNQTTVTLANYNTVYYPMFGNNPVIQILVSDGAGGFIPDNTTTPTYVYQTPNDPSSALLSVTWGYPIATSGYILLFGIAPTT